MLGWWHSLIPTMKPRFATPELLDVYELDGELRYVKEGNATLKIGPVARHKEDVLESDVVMERYALLAAAEAVIVDPLVRNIGTIGGALVHGDPADQWRKGVA
jgi:aerobic carbon-monoxide dehydrogenase medium subunit